MSNSEIFLEKYKMLEEAVRITYNLRNEDSISHFLSNTNKYKKYVDEIRYCQDVRNLLSHKKKINQNFAVDASDEMILFIDELINKIKKRQKCSDIQIGFKKVCWRSLSDKVKETMSVMREKSYTHIPILNDKKEVIGVFDENSVFMYIADEGIVAIDENLTFSQIEKYLSLEGREMESFIFVKPNFYVDELEDKIEDAFNKGQRIELAFVTANGSKNEKLQGIISPLDLI